MIISNIKISNFRNIVAADVKFSNINILTGRNSSGKTNFLLALINSMSTKYDHSEIFDENVVTFGQGKTQANFSVTLEQLKKNVCYIQDEFVTGCINPEKYTFEKSLDKTGMAKKNCLRFSGKVFFPKTSKLTYTDIMGKDDEWETWLDKIVYEKKFEFIDQDGFNKTVKRSGKPMMFEDEFLSQLTDFEHSTKSWIDSDSKYDFSSSLIHKYVTEPINSDVLQESLERISSNKASKGLRKSNFRRAKFIHLLADIQADKGRHAKFNKEIAHYTGGVVCSVKIGKGKVNKEVVIESPNGPKSVSSISSGTAIILYFVLLKNWLYLNFESQSFVMPQLMVFDELDSTIHPTLMSMFVELLRSVSVKVQLFITTHSPLFLDCFEKQEVYLLKDAIFGINDPDVNNKCNIYDYHSIIEKLPDEEARESLNKQSNSELFISGMIDSLFHG